jgi:tetratricopeptide (TPR) repeat protein
MNEVERSATIKKNNNIALAGFIIGLFSIFLFIFGIIPIIGILVSVIGLITIKKEIHKNKWMAISGLCLCVIFMFVNFWIYSGNGFNLKSLFGGFSTKNVDSPPGITMTPNKAYNDANTHFSKNEYALGMNALQESAKDGYRNPLLFLRLANEFGRLEKYIKGIEYNSKAIDILESKDIQVMFPNELEMISKNKNDVIGSAYSQRAALLFHSGDINNAKIAVDKALKFSSQNNNAQTIDTKGRIALHEARYDEAIKIFRDLLRKSPNFIDGKFFLGKALIKQGQIDEGVTLLNEFIGRAPLSHPSVKLARELIKEAQKSK